MNRGIGKRGEKRIAAVYPIRLWGMDANGRAFIKEASTVNVSRKGALLKDIPIKLAVGDIIGLTWREQKYRFHVTWVGQDGTQESGQVGLQSLDRYKQIWDVKLPADGIDIFTPDEYRLLMRVKCSLSAEVWSCDRANQRTLTFIRDLSVGGCYVTITSPLPVKSRLKIALWLDEETKIWVDGTVISSHPSVGMGVRFLDLPRRDQEAIAQFLNQLSKSQTA
jgi:hypothetical protein